MNCKCCGLPAQFCYRDRLAPMIKADRKLQENLVKHPNWDVNPIANDEAIAKQLRVELWRKVRRVALWWALGLACGFGLAALVLR